MILMLGKKKLAPLTVSVTKVKKRENAAFFNQLFVVARAAVALYELH